jgi:hypothetical protein
MVEGPNFQNGFAVRAVWKYFLNFDKVSYFSG